MVVVAGTVAGVVVGFTVVGVALEEEVVDEVVVDEVVVDEDGTVVVVVPDPLPALPPGAVVAVEDGVVTDVDVDGAVVVVDPEPFPALPSGAVVVVEDRVVVLVAPAPDEPAVVEAEADDEGETATAHAAKTTVSPKRTVSWV